ncbi:hypothetical protein [Pseudomonas tohonis]|uniref:hypothetical protein n=1 Tax=Pseudomonas tohonis TaxID=2725477 RepID=UPI001F2DD2CA|nr:hypothetical protein [Pseudomonas tohonis]
MSIHIPHSPEEDLRPTVVVAEGLLNPRGLCRQPDGSLLLVEAGSGHPDAPFSGRISRLRPAPGSPGAYLAPEPVARGYRSMNMQVRMLRDEVMGLSDVACADGRCLASLTDYVEGSRVLDLGQDPPVPVFHSRGNLNALCFHPGRRTWLSVKPDTNQVVEFDERGERVVAQIPDMDQGQDAVPVTLVYEPTTGAVLVSLFSGERRLDPTRQGIDFVERAGQVIRVWPEDGSIQPLVDGLQLPTGLAFTPGGGLLVLELCRTLLQPLDAQWRGEARHGGFERFSGRLLHCDLASGTVRVLATGLDTPSNLCLLDDAVLVSEGMGLHGRPLPLPGGGTVPLDGRIRRIALQGCI